MKAGTGKSFLIRILTREITKKYGKFDNDKKLLKPVVLIVAPTGLAALNIKGATAYKAFKIPVMKGHLQPLTEDVMKPLQVALSDVKLIIWDEIGMSSSAAMAIASMRLNQLHPELQNEDNVRLSSFGGMNMLLLGDLLQIQPVKGAFPFEVNKANSGTIKGISIDKDLWKHFDDMPLTKSQRQKNIEFPDLADDVRYGNCSDKHQQMLKDRIVHGLSANSTPEDIAETLIRIMPDDGVCLVSHKVLANNINLNFMGKKGIAQVEILANDFTEKGANSKLKSDKAEGVVDNDTGLKTKLIIGIGAKVMLLFNKGIGLVNGSTGIVKEIVFNQNGKHVKELKVLFEGKDEITIIERVEREFKYARINYNRQQFPLMLAYALTIHKCQGMTLDTALIDLGPNTFGDGMAYVALTRLKELKNLHLIDFDVTKISANKNCITEVNRIARLTNQPQITVYNMTRKDIITNAKARKTFSTVGEIPSPVQVVPARRQKPVNIRAYKRKRTTRQNENKTIRRK